jgi:hypothetical protein
MVATFPSQSTAPSGRPLSEGEKTATLIRGFATQSASRSPETPFDLIQYSGEVTGEPRTFRTALLRSGVRVVSVEPRSGIVTEAAMAQSTGNPYWITPPSARSERGDLNLGKVSTASISIGLPCRVPHINLAVRVADPPALLAGGTTQ